jgi:predicted DNA-binding ribbon-helix-helix protein
MSAKRKTMRQSVSLPSRLAHRVRTLANRRKVSTNRVLVELIETGFESQAAEKARFLELADRLVESRNPAERRRLKQELARMTFGE